MSKERNHRSEWIKGLIASHRSGWSLEQAFYTDPEIFEREMERIFVQHWLITGHVSRIPKPGDYFVYEISGESIIIIRGHDGQIHALFNVCRHRGSRICMEAAGNVKKFVCPYHSWVYETDGTLLAARHMLEDFDKSQFGLIRCAVRLLEGLIFISLGQAPPDFEPMVRALGPFLKPHGLDHAKVCHRVRYEVKANWKVVAENSWECYHCGTAHREFGSVMSYVAAMDSKKLAEEDKAFTAQWEAYVSSRGHKTGAVELNSNRWYQCSRVPIRPGFLTQSRDGQPVAPLMGSFTEYDGGVSGCMFYPLSFFVASSDHAVLSRFTPIDPKLTEVELTWLVREDAVEGVDYDLERVTWLWRVTGAQDVKLCENNQAGVDSRRYQSGPYSQVEGEVDRFIQWYLNQIA